MQSAFKYQDHDKYLIANPAVEPDSKGNRIFPDKPNWTNNV